MDEELKANLQAIEKRILSRVELAEERVNSALVLEDLRQSLRFAGARFARKWRLLNGLTRLPDLWRPSGCPR